jgi:LPS export ABC transporter permease LptG
MSVLWRERRTQRDASRRNSAPSFFPICVHFVCVAGHADRRASPARRPRRRFLITLLLITGYYLMFTIGAGLARQGDHTHLDGNLVGKRHYRGAGPFSLAASGAHAGQRPHQRRPGMDCYPVGFGNFSLEKIAPRRPFQTAHPSEAVFSPEKRLGPESRSLLDVYLLRSFIYYFVLLTVGFIVLFEVFTFFELLDDIAQHRTTLFEVILYFLYLACYLFYQLAPLAALVSVLVTLGVLTKNNELVAFKASGLSLYRISIPLLLGGIFLAGSLLVLDDTYLPYANQRQDALRNQIKGRPAQTYYQPSRQWIFGERAKIYNYELFDSDRELFGGLNVFELDPATFEIKRRVYAARAHWDRQQAIWILESGWIREFDHGKLTRYTPFLANALNEISEPPSYFNREVRQSYQMTWWELERYITDLRQAGFDVARLSVQLQKKLSFPLVAPIIILLAIPFSILVGTRGAIGGLALGVGIAIVYWAASALTEAMGAVGQLPPLLAAWAPDTVFGFLGLYFYLRMPT